MAELKYKENDLKKLLQGVRTASDKELGRAVSLLENNKELGQDILSKLQGSYQPAYLLGITGPPGSGKSSLIDSLLKKWLAENKRIAVIAVDPSSSVSGGAFLGDRIRMNTITKHENVFVRSMSTRGSTGGLNPAVYDTFMLLSAAGFDMIVIETVGVGQTEIDIISFADTTAVVSVPEAGDEIQIFKSDLLELGDVFVLNKADLPGAERMELIIKQLFNLKNTRKSSDNKIQTFSQADWQPELIKTSTVNNQGLDELKEKIDQHREYLKHNGILKEKFRQSIEKQLLYKMEEKIYKKLIKKIKKEGNYKEQLGAIISGKLTPNQAAEKLLENKINI